MYCLRYVVYEIRTYVIFVIDNYYHRITKHISLQDDVTSLTVFIYLGGVLFACIPFSVYSMHAYYNRLSCLIFFF